MRMFCDIEPHGFRDQLTQGENFPTKTGANFRQSIGNKIFTANVTRDKEISS